MWKNSVMLKSEFGDIGCEAFYSNQNSEQMHIANQINLYMMRLE